MRSKAIAGLCGGALPRRLPEEERSLLWPFCLTSLPFEPRGAALFQSVSLVADQ